MHIRDARYAELFDTSVQHPSIHVFGESLVSWVRDKDVEVRLSQFGRGPQRDHIDIRSNSLVPRPRTRGISEKMVSSAYVYVGLRGLLGLFGLMHRNS